MEIKKEPRFWKNPWENSEKQESRRDVNKDVDNAVKKSEENANEAGVVALNWKKVQEKNEDKFQVGSDLKGRI